MGCFQSRDKTVNIKGHFMKDLKEPKNTVQKFVYDKTLQPIEAKDEILELCRLELTVLNKANNASSSDKSRYLKLRSKVESELNQISRASSYNSDLYSEEDKTLKLDKLKPFDFIDPYFQPRTQSLFDSKMGRHPLADRWEGFVWKRPVDVYGEGQFHIFRGINPNDIKQGY